MDIKIATACGEVFNQNSFRHSFASPRRDAPESCKPFARENRGRGECRVPAAPAASCAKCWWHTSVATTGPPETPGIPARNGFNGFLRALPGDRACLPPSSTDNSANLTPASGRQDHTTSPSAHMPFVSDTATSTASRPASVTIAIRPSVGRDGKGYRFDLGLAGTEIFLKMGLDSRTAEQPVGQINHECLVDLILKSARIYLRPHPCVTALPLSPAERVCARLEGWPRAAAHSKSMSSYRMIRGSGRALELRPNRCLQPAKPDNRISEIIP
jgi:hypothetical protein